MAKSWNFVSVDPWNLKEMQKLVDEYAKLKRRKEIEFSTIDKLRAFQKTRNFVGIMKFGHMDDEVYAKYSELKSKFAYDDLDLASAEHTDKRETIYKDRCIKFALAFKKHTNLLDKQIANIVEMTPTNYSMMMKDQRSNPTESSLSNQGRAETKALQISENKEDANL